MACFAPLYGWQRPDGGPLFFGAELPNTRRVDIPCGYCLGCRLSRARAWAIRCMHEAQMHSKSCFVTLTYDDEHYLPSLNYNDFQLFMKRLRKASSEKVRFFVVGEYGEKFKRPHFHALLFGTMFPALQQIGTGLYRSGELEKLWPYGYSSIGSVSYESAGYCARYAVKKVVGPGALNNYRRVDVNTGEIVSVVPEFAHMSLKPGLGFSWFEKYWKEVYVARDGVCRPGGRTIPAPRAYDKWLESMDSDLREYRDYTRYISSAKFVADCTPERLAVREHVARARLEFMTERNLE